MGTELYEEYKKLFNFKDPFNPEEYLIYNNFISNNLEENTWTDLNLACVESLNRFDVCKKSMRTRRLRDISPQINLNLTNLNIQAINIPNVPPEVSREQLNMLVRQVVSGVVQQSLNDATQIALQQLIKSLPQAGFEHFSFNSGWKKEEYPLKYPKKMERKFRTRKCHKR